MNLIQLHKISFYTKKHKIPIIYKITEALIFLLYNSRVPSTVTIGKNTKFAYLGIGCVIHKDTIIGKNCLIGQGITIGGRGPRIGVPVIGDNVYLGPGCRIIGPITIGNNVIIGPNAVVISDIPSNSIAVGVPAKIVKSDVPDVSIYL
jgi:serine O-acetyltransferase